MASAHLSLALLVLLLASQSLGLQRLPPPPSSLAQLAKSAASIRLAADFLAQEQLLAGRQQQPTQKRPQLVAASQTSLVSQEPTFSRSLGSSFRLDQYHSLAEIDAFIDQLARRHPQRLQVFTIGRTHEQRPIRALELTNNATDPDYVWLDALTHAREWVTGSTLLHILDNLVAGPQNPLNEPPTALHSKNYLMVPVVNPDGYHYTWTTNRMWRKNRSRSPDSRCVGADLNRNFDHSFGGEGSSADPCSHIYAGQGPFSEPETRSLAELLWALRKRVKFYLTLHSYNQLWACPYAHTTEQSAHLSQHLRVLRQIQRAVQEAEGVRYEIGPLSTSLYVGSGFGIDFAYDKCGIEHSYLVELRDKGQHGFVLPADQIMPTARETLAGLRAGLSAVFGY